jgi:very-short-patch-repair endonuclease
MRRGGFFVSFFHVPDEATDNLEEYRSLAGRKRRLGSKGKLFVAHLKRNATKGETALWKLLRRQQILGLKFRRQHKIGKFVVDFFCIPLRLAVEVDGSAHLYRQHEDEARTRWLAQFGIRVLKFTNEDVIRRPRLVCKEIEKAAKAYLKDSRPARSPLSSQERGAKDILPSPRGER